MCDIFVTDDDEQMRAMLAASLEGLGYEVEQAGGAIELFECLTGLARAGALPAILICDYRMPGADGLAVIEKIKNEYPAIEVFLITAFGDEHVHARARALGAAAVFDKPFALGRLHERIAEVLRGQGTS